MKEAISFMLVLMIFSTVNILSYSIGSESVTKNEGVVFDLSLMNSDEKVMFFEAVELEVRREQARGEENFDAEIFRRELVKFLQSNHLFHVMNSLEKRDSTMSLKDRHGTWVPDVRIANRLVAASINVAIALKVGGAGGGALKEYIRRVGRRAAERMFNKTIGSILIAWGAPGLAKYLEVPIAFIFEFTNFGQRIAEYLDSRDDFPNNGFVDLVL